MQLRSRLVQFLSAGHFIAFVCATSLSVTSQLPFSGSETNVKPHVPSSSTLSFGDTLPESTLGPTTTAPDKQDGGLAQNLNHVTTNATTTTISATTTTTTTTATSAIVTTTNTTSATATASVTITGKSEDPPKKANTNATIASAEPASGAATKKPTQAPSSGSGPPVSTTTQAESLRSHNVSITTVFSVRTIDFRVGSMIEATRKRPMARVMANALEKIGYANFTSTDVGLVTTTRMLREQTTFGESLVHNRQIVNTSQRSSSAKKIVTVARWYPCGFGRRRCVSPDKCVHSDTGAVCAPQEDNPSLDASNFISYWALQLSVDCRCVSMIDSDLHKTKFPLDATFGPPPKWGRLSAMKNPFPRCKNRTGTRIASGDGLPCWCGVQLLICHALQSCVEHAEHPHLSRCESSDKILPWARKQQLKPCPTDEGKVYEGKSLCTCVKGQAYCVRGQRCVKNTPDGLPTCQSPYNVCPNDGPSMEDVCYCKWRACARIRL